MPAFSHSQPVFTSEEEELEHADLTNEQREAILDDLRGRLLDDIVVPENDEAGGDTNGQPAGEDDDNDEDIDPILVSDYVTEMEKIPFEDKVDYLQALVNNEALFETECNPIRFLRATDYDPESAAKRMTKYWQMRVKIFGEARAFLPMTLTGALKDDVKEWLTIPTVCCLLPTDVKGRTVMCLDRTTNSDIDSFSRFIGIRIFFYVVHVAIQRRFTQINGVVFLHIKRMTSLSHFDRTTSKLSHQAFKDCFPMKICAVHGFPSGIVSKFITPVIKFFLGTHLRTRLVEHKPGLTGHRLIRELETYGLLRDRLPKGLGGNYIDNRKWLQKRLQIEEESKG